MRPRSFLSALLAVQSEAPRSRRTRPTRTSHSKFTGLDTIVEKVGPLLVKHRLVWITKPGRDELGPYLEYRLVHVDSGDGLIGRMPLLLSKDDSQGLGSALTYARRYALVSVLNLVADEDDDGNSASSATASRRRAQPSGPREGAGQPVARGRLPPGRARGPRAPWAALGNVPEQHYDGLYAALTAARAAEER
jgi:hypothetical protein